MDLLNNKNYPQYSLLAKRNETHNSNFPEMYIPSVDMGEYDDYSSRTSRLPPGAPQDRNLDRHTDRQRDRHTDRKRMEQQFSRIPRLVTGRVIKS